MLTLLLVDSEIILSKVIEFNREKTLVNFDQIVPVLAKENVGHDWWTVDLCFWPEAWDATEKCKSALDNLV